MLKRLVFYFLILFLLTGFRANIGFWKKSGPPPAQWFGNIYWDGVDKLIVSATPGTFGTCNWNYAYPPYSTGARITFTVGVAATISTGDIGQYLYWPCACCATTHMTATYDGINTIVTTGGYWPGPINHTVVLPPLN